jgi:hypothetical protein
MLIDFEPVSKFIPFALVTGKTPRWNLQRVLEGLIIASITGVITLYGVQKSHEVQIMSIREDLYRMRTDMQQRIDDIRISVRDNTASTNAREDRIEAKLDGHISRTAK